MTERKFTDEEIIKALECCINEDDELFNCKGCVFMECKMGKGRECTYYMLKSAHDLINRQKAEIERLKGNYDKATDNLKAVLEERADRSEAIKDFAERLCEGRVSNDPVVIAVKAELK